MSNALSRRIRSASVAVAALAAAVAPGLAVAPAAAAPAAPQSGCAGFSAAAAGDLVTLRLLDLRPLGLALPPTVDLTLASSRAGFSGSAGQAAAQGRYAEGRVLGFAPPLGPLDATAHRIAPPAAEPLAVNPGRLALGPARAGTGNLTARSAYGTPGRCDTAAGVDSESTAALTDAAVLPGRRPLVQAADNFTTGTRTGFVRHRGGTGAEAVSSGGLTNLAIFEALRVRVFNPVSLRVVASGSAASSVVDYQSPIIALDLPDGREVKLDQANRSFDIALPGPAGTQPMPGMPMLPNNTLPDLLNAVPGGAAAVPVLGKVLESIQSGGQTGVPESAGSAKAPNVPGLPEMAGVPAVGGLLGGTGRLATTPTQTSLVLRLTGGELAKEVTDSGVHAKAISLRVKLLVVRGEGITTLVDLAIGVLEAAATAPSAAPVEGRDNGNGNGNGPTRGNAGYGGGEEPDAPPSASASAPAPGGDAPSGGGSRLPVTGTALSAAVGAGVVLLLAGRFLLLLTRRRTDPPLA
ncbi:hypothetical protein [Virgisporangium ochraceum]|uniref:LPXTG-motif cell wall anchor domain protein n=1 Tax=Virgisporangium ochraceum TaxID=65505 RepID=A0A8J4EJS2_9ACTN|nr:hypothetical protein [Virgisporangium ochraceum]GIJ74622.1 hypothetical protein Voc01_095390 [Virgisporangium ochraceum]